MWTWLSISTKTIASVTIWCFAKHTSQQGDIQDLSGTNSIFPATMFLKGIFRAWNIENIRKLSVTCGNPAKYCIVVNSVFITDNRKVSSCFVYNDVFARLSVNACVVYVWHWSEDSRDVRYVFTDYYICVHFLSNASWKKPVLTYGTWLCANN